MLAPRMSCVHRRVRREDEHDEAGQTIVILDNLGAHKRTAVETAIRSVGATLEYLPAYSPDLNPIEKMWSKIKAFLRAAKARTSRALNSAIRKAFKCITSDDALSWFASCG